MGTQATLQRFPVAYFTVVMGLAGLTLALDQAARVLGWPVAPARAALLATVLALLAVLGAYGAKLLAHRQAVAAEWSNPATLSLFPAASISLLLTSAALAPVAAGLSGPLLAAGALLHLALTLAVMSLWVHHTRFEIEHSNPAWFLPVVGNILVAVAGAGRAPAELLWFFYSVGLVFWLVLFPIILYRLIFHPPLPERLLPTLFILVAPPAVAFLGYLALTDTLDTLARVLYHAAAFLTLLLAVATPRFSRLPFALSWWAYSFPLAAFTIATLSMYARTGLGFFHGLALVLLALLVLIMAILVSKTARAIARHGLPAASA
jgi:tellurite resistance protein